MSLGEYLLGLLILAGTWGCTQAAAWVAVVRLTPRLTGVARVLAFALVGLAALIGAHLVPGLIGILSRWSALAAAVLLLMAAWRLLPRRPGAPADDAPPAAAESGPVSWALAGTAVAAVACFTVAKLWAATREASADVDTLTFHLPSIGAWLQSGSVWRVDQFTPLLGNGSYPHNGDLIVASLLAPFEFDAFIRLVNAPFVVLAGLSVYAIARELAAPRATAVLSGALFAAMPVVSYAAYDGVKTDAIMWAAFGSSALFLLRHLRLGGASNLVLAGLGLGIAFGTKWYGVSAAVIMMAVWATAALVSRTSVRAVVRGGAILGGLIAAAGGFWLVRNAVESGSPLFPVAVPPLWDTPHDFARVCAGYSIADYLGDGGIWVDYVYPAYRDNYAAAGALIGLGWLVAAVLCAFALVRRSRPPGLSGAATLVTATAALACAYAVTPYSALGLDDQPFQIGANTRWLVPALLLAAALLAWTLGRVGRVPRTIVEAVALVATVVGLERGVDLPARTVAAAALAIALLGAAGYAVLLLSRRAGGAARRVQLAAASLGLLTLVALGYARQRDFASDRFTREGDPVIAYLAQQATAGHRVAVAGVPSVNGTAPIWPAYGPHFDNRVEYAGHFVDGQLREYDDRATWTRAIERGGYDLLVVGRGGYAKECNLPGSRSDDDAFARAAGYRVLASTPRLTLYAVR